MTDLIIYEDDIAIANLIPNEDDIEKNITSIATPINIETTTANVNLYGSIIEIDSTPPVINEIIRDTEHTSLTKYINNNYINTLMFLSICSLIIGSILHKNKIVSIILIIIGIPGSLFFSI